MDPDAASLSVAQARTMDIEWVEATAASMPFVAEFGLAVMTGHAFQALLADEDIRASLGAVEQALVPGGMLAFETRNPLARAWEGWNPDNAVEVVDPSGETVRVWHEVESVVGDVVTLTETTGAPDGTPWRVDRASLRFLDREALAGFLHEAGFVVMEQLGGWANEPLDESSPEIVTIAKRRA